MINVLEIRQSMIMSTLLGHYMSIFLHVFGLSRNFYLLYKTLFVLTWAFLENSDGRVMIGLFYYIHEIQKRIKNIINLL